ncbi:hypothetical protein D3C72_1631200 [compost metagenome]
MNELALPSNEASHCQRRTQQQAPSLGDRAAVQRHQSVEQAQRAYGAQQKAPPVQCFTLPIRLHAARGGHRNKLIGQPDGDEAQRNDHEEDRTPAEPIHQQPTDAGADGRCQHHPHAEDTAGAALLVGAEGVKNDDRGNRLHHARSEPFGHPRDQNQAEIPRQATAYATRQ